MDRIRQLDGRRIRMGGQQPPYYYEVRVGDGGIELHLYDGSGDASQPVPVTPVSRDLDELHDIANAVVLDGPVVREGGEGIGEQSTLDA